MRYLALVIVAGLVAAVALVAYGAYEVFGPDPCTPAERAILDDIRHFGGADVEFERPGGLNLFGADCQADPDFDAPPAEVMRHYERELRRLGFRAKAQREGGSHRVSADRGKELQDGHAEFAAWYYPPNHVDVASGLEEEGFGMFVSVLGDEE